MAHPQTPIGTQRILYLVPDLFGPPGGIARYCRLVAQALCELNLVPTVVALNDALAARAESAQALARINYQPCARSRVTFMRAALAAIRERPTLVIAGHPHFAHIAWLIARLAGARLAVWMYGVDVWAPLSTLRRAAFQRADTWFAISHFTARRGAAANAIPAERVRILFNCLDPRLDDTLAPAEKSGPPRLLTVARMSSMEKYKGHEYVLRALPALLARFPDLRYHIIGDGDERPTLEALARALNVAHATHFHGVVPDATLARHYAEATLFIMPSAGEGFGFVFLEAMVHGTPAIGGNQDATPEVIVHGETGLLVTPTSIAEITEAVTQLLSDPARRAHMGSAGRTHVHQNFGYPAFRQRLHELLKELA